MGLFAVLDKFGFGANVTFGLNYFTLTLLRQVALIRNSHNLFGLHRGMRQEGPLSPILFVLTTEPLAIVFRTNKDVSGMWRCNTEHNVSLYTDDLVLFISNPTASSSLLCHY